MTDNIIKNIAEDLNADINDVGVLPDGSGFAVMSFNLPDDHWLFQETTGYEPPPMPMRMGTDDPRRQEFAEALRAAGKYALRSATMNGKEDYDPDAVLQNLIVGMLGYWTPDGLSEDDWANPPNVRGDHEKP